MSKYIIFDVETTGLPKNYKTSPKFFKLWPHIVQFSWILVDTSISKQETSINSVGQSKTAEKQYIIERDFIIKPSNYIIPKESIKIHKITNKKAKEEGIPLVEVLKIFKEDCDKVNMVIAHNASFDKSVVLAACYRTRRNVNFLLNKKIICTMKSTTDLCKLKGKYGYKYPKLIELYYFLFQEKPTTILHNSLEDVKVTLKCYNELIKRKFFDIILFL